MQKILLFLGLLSIPAIADDLHVFTNGEVADADKINENFEILQASGGGCSAEQDDNTVTITCADGTTGILAGAGTVVQIREGEAGELPPIDFNTGPIVAIDGNDTVLGEVGSFNASSILISISSNPYERLRLVNDEVTKSVLYGRSLTGRIFYTEEGCQGAALVMDSESPPWQIGDDFFTDSGTSYTILKRSMRWSAYYSSDGQFEAESECLNNGESVVSRVRQAVTYTPADEIVNAVYPVRVEQLP